MGRPKVVCRSKLACMQPEGRFRMAGKVRAVVELPDILITVRAQPGIRGRAKIIQGAEFIL
jgi:hypothetical protein